MLRKYFLYVAKKQVFSYPQIFFLAQDFFPVRKKNLVTRKKDLAAEKKNVLSLYHGIVFLASEIISRGVYIYYSRISRLHTWLTMFHRAKGADDRLFL